MVKKKDEIATPEATENLKLMVESVDKEVLDGMGKTNRMRLTHAAEDSLTLRQKQAAGAEYLASLVSHPDIRKRLVAAAMMDPVAILKIASSERPKEIHLEAEIQHSVVVVPAQLSADEWDKQVKTLEEETLKEESW